MAGKESDVKKEPEIQPVKWAVSGMQAGWTPPEAGAGMPEGGWRPESQTAGSAGANPDTAVSPDGEYPDTAASPDREYPDTAASSGGKCPDRAVSPVGQYPPAAPTAMLIRIFGKKDREPYGDIVHYDLKKPVPYQGAAELVLRIDAISRSLDPSGSGSAFRSVKKTGDESVNLLPDEYRAKEVTDRKPMAHEPPDQGSVHREPAEKESPPPKIRDTIYLQLIGRQHTSIQGRIWGRATRKRYVSFRSALELIYLLSEAV